ncbi:uncharacterized protein [Salminus brasiliensis]|uniref:uncharacterized protein n=1 Tax=Salminus brasiliensis TaxID=930266 RepID=UPI003B835227
MASPVFHLIISLVVLQGLLLITRTNTEELDCLTSIRVPRSTVWKAPEKRTLKINCTVIAESHCWKNVSALWCRIDDDNNKCTPLNHYTRTTAEWTNDNRNERMFFLTFWNLSMEDAGLYRCQTHAPVSTESHNINVTVTESETDIEVISNENKTTNGSQSEPPDMVWLWPYVYICSGIVVLVLIVIVVTLLLIWCRGTKQSRKEQIAENQFSAAQTPSYTPPVHGANRPGNTHSLPAQLSPESNCIYGNAPIRASSQRDGPSRRHPASHGAKPGRRCDRFSAEVEDEDNPLVYASLNHKVKSRAPVRVTHPEETSEYAAIRVY